MFWVSNKEIESALNHEMSEAINNRVELLRTMEHELKLMGEGYAYHAGYLHGLLKAEQILTEKPGQARGESSRVGLYEEY